MRAEVTLLSRVIFGIDEDSVVRASGHAGLAADANGFIKIDDPVCALEHGRGGTGGNAGRVRALIATRYLVRAPDLRKDADVNVLDVSSGHADRHDVLGFARRRARMTTNTAGMVNDLGPLHAISSS